jgi:hypothetical protein
MKKATLLFAITFVGLNVFSQNKQNNDKAEVLYPTSFGISKPLSELFSNGEEDEESTTIERKESEDREHRKPQVFKYTAADGPEYGEDPNVRQTMMGDRPSPGTKANWQGQSGNGYPPDPTGAIGPNHYVQAVNASPYKIFNKTTGAQIGTVKQISSLFGLTTNDGDPIVLYDKYADRWFISQFGSSGNKIYIAISTTADPTGTYYTYTYTSPQFPDYLKFSIWADGYYMTSNQGTDRIFVFERDQMLLGNAAARSLNKTFTTNSGSNGFFVPMPADADGQLPPAGSPFIFVAYNENAWGTGVDAVRIWNMTVNWTPATPTATITGPTSIPTAAFDGTFNAGWNDIPQPNSTQKLDGIGGVIQYRAQWRKWAGYNTLMVCWPVQINTTTPLRSIRWTELRQDQTTGVWSIYQESTFSPDNYSRWMGGIAMDDEGNIALCYAKSGPTSVTPNVSPSLGYTGRLASDPLGTMTFAETIAIAGSGAQGSNINRFGDYSQTTLDPSDGLTFWHTGEYLVNGGVRTRIYSFKLSPTITGVENAQPNIPLLFAFQSNDLLNVKANNLPSNELMMVDLFDANGKLIKSKMVTPNANSIDTNIEIEGLAKGTYLIRIAKQNTSFQKVIKTIIQ